MHEVDGVGMGVGRAMGVWGGTALRSGAYSRQAPTEPTGLQALHTPGKPWLCFWFFLLAAPHSMPLLICTVVVTTVLVPPLQGTIGLPNSDT